ncbi:MAG TPA: hypothetical protein VJG29_01490 [Candidatus Paceibacterota bacterium]
MMFPSVRAADFLLALCLALGLGACASPHSASCGQYKQTSSAYHQCLKAHADNERESWNSTLRVQAQKERDVENIARRSVKYEPGVGLIRTVDCSEFPLYGGACWRGIIKGEDDALRDAQRLQRKADRNVYKTERLKAAGSP